MLSVKNRAILGILAALAALGAVLTMSVAVYADGISLPGHAVAHAEVTAPEDQDPPPLVDGGSTADVRALIDNTSSGDASATANAVNDAGSSSASNSVSVINEGSEGTASSSANATASGGGDAETQATSNLHNGGQGTANSIANSTATGEGSSAVTNVISQISDGSSGTTNAVANAVAINGGYAEAATSATVMNGATGNNAAYAYANSTGADAISSTSIQTTADTPAPGFYYGVYASGDSFALAFLFVPTPNTVIGFTYANGGSTGVIASINVSGSDISVTAIPEPPAPPPGPD